MTRVAGGGGAGATTTTSSEPAGPAIAPEDPTRPDVGRAAARVRERRAPKHDERTRARWRRADAAKRERRRAEREEPELEREPYVANEVSIAACSLLAGTLWRFTATLFANRRPLTDEEAREVGAALDPVLYKYLPALGEWALELNLAAVVYALWEKVPERDPLIEHDRREVGAPA